MRRAAKWIVVGWIVLMLFAIAPLARAQTVYDQPMRPIIIRGDKGGVVKLYLTAWRDVERSDNIVIIDGECASACTLFIGIVRRDKVCFTERGYLAFHAAARCKADMQTMSCISKPTYNKDATNDLLSHYPADVRAWIAKRGGLSTDLSKYHIMRGKELEKFIRRC